MPKNTHVELAEASERFFGSAGQEGAHDAGLIAARAAECARSLVWLPDARAPRRLVKRSQMLARELGKQVAVLEKPSATQSGDSEEWRWFRENVHLLRSLAAKLPEAERMLRSLPHVVRDNGEIVPRVIAIAEDLLGFLTNRFVDSEMSTYLRAFQGVTVLLLQELQALPAAFNAVLLERISVFPPLAGEPGSGGSAHLHSQLAGHCPGALEGVAGASDRF